ncbi:MAG: TMEM165/GDT1 family protein [Candidatus Omnitrophica bacterium]|nr:TMEM165/GDT1 family protein [Candidatus Omnitrophota bacterium]
MHWKPFLIAFGTIFLAELGDKTQLAVIGLAAYSRNLPAVFLGAVCALSVVTLIGVMFGGAIIKFIPTHTLHVVIGSVFIIVGLLMVTGRL